MPSLQIAVLIGSLRRDSHNRKLAEAVIKLAPSDIAFVMPRIDDLPLYNQDDDGSPADVVKRFKNEIAASAGVIFVTPEYNRSVPGVLKNAIDHASRPYGKSVWAGKPAGVMGASIGAPGSSMAQQHLRCVLGYLDMPTLGQPELFIHVKDGLFDDNGGVADAGLEKLLRTWMDKFVVWVKRHAQPAPSKG